MWITCDLMGHAEHFRYVPGVVESNHSDRELARTTNSDRQATLRISFTFKLLKPSDLAIVA